MSSYLRLAAYRAVALHCGTARITSQALGLQVGVDASQVRRDITQLLGSGLGTRGQGYDPVAVAAAVQIVLTGQWDLVMEEARVLGSIVVRVIRAGAA